MPKLLVIDDEPAIRHAFRRAFRDSEIEIHEAESAADALAGFAQLRPDVVVLDIHLPDASGLETLRLLRAANAQAPIILITGHGTTDLAIEAMKEGAFDYLLKPVELATLRELIGRAVRSSRQNSAPERFTGELSTGSEQLIGRCALMQDVYKAIGRVARQDVSVLLTGESGTGKELVARALHQHSNRNDKPFIAINCGAIPETLLESELFGHEKGAFTSAERRRIGRFEQADGGTIFLDEVGEMTPLAQVKLLRVLQERVIERVGGEGVLPTDVRVIAATNADLVTMVTNGSFRQDLFFRLNVYTIKLPPLRERGDDLDLLTNHFLRNYSEMFDRPIQEVAPEVRAVLRAYSWPGNVRELQSILKQAVLHMGGPTLLVDDLPKSITAPTQSKTATQEYGWDQFLRERLDSNSTKVYSESVAFMEREVLVRVLKHTGGNQLQAAKILGITRGSLRNKIRELGIAIKNDIFS